MKDRGKPGFSATVSLTRSLGETYLCCGYTIEEGARRRHWACDALPNRTLDQKRYLGSSVIKLFAQISNFLCFLYRLATPVENSRYPGHCRKALLLASLVSRQQLGKRTSNGKCTSLSPRRSEAERN